MERKINWNCVFDYDETSPSCLRWKIDRWVGQYYSIPRVLQGDVAGGLNSAGYWVVTYQGNTRRVHRIILEMHGIKCTGFDVDHINRKRSDNKFNNLRLATRKINTHNRGPSTRNKTGVNGVSYDCTRDRYRASWNDIEGIFRAKYFSCRKLGTDLAFSSACSYRENMINVLNSQGSGYTENHGR